MTVLQGSRGAAVLGLVLSALICPTLWSVPAVAQERRVALVIGNGAYVHTPSLANPVRDARAMAEALEAIGFDRVETATDLDRTGLQRTLGEFATQARGAAVALVFYSGHGMEIGRRNYLIPVDARLQSEADARWEGVTLEDVQAAVEGAAGLQVVVLDACRNNRFPAQTRSAVRGFEREAVQGPRLVAYSTAPGTVAQDGDGSLSPYTQALVERLRAQPQQDVRVLFSSLGRRVTELGGAGQVPHVELGSLPETTLALAPVLREPDMSVRVPVTECDRLAALPDSVERLVLGVSFDMLDASRAVPACREAVERWPNEPRLAALYGRALDKQGNEAEALGWYRTAAEGGDLSAMLQLGVTYADGRKGQTRDDAVAERWFRTAAEAGYARAMTNLGVLYMNNRGVLANDAEAVRWLRRAASAGNASGMNFLGYMYANGRGLTRDDAEAVRWFRRAAEAGDASGMTNLGLMYANGRGVSRDDAKAVHWYRAAAAAGNAEGMNFLAAMYANGRGGLTQDDAEAARLLRIAAAAGSETAKRNLARLRREGRCPDC